MGAQGSAQCQSPAMHTDNFDHNRKKHYTDNIPESIYSIEAESSVAFVDCFRSKDAVYKPPSDKCIYVDYMTAQLLLRDKSKIQELVISKPTDLREMCQHGKEIQDKIEDAMTRNDDLDDDTLAKIQEQTDAIYELEIPSVLSEIDRFDTITSNREKSHVHSEIDKVDTDTQRISPFADVPCVQLREESLSPLPSTPIL